MCIRDRRDREPDAERLDAPRGPHRAARCRPDGRRPVPPVQSERAGVLRRGRGARRGPDRRLKGREMDAPTCPHCGTPVTRVLDLPYGYWEWGGTEYRL